MPEFTRSAALLFLLVLVACSSKETASPDLGMASNPAALPEHAPQETAPAFSPARSSTKPEFPSPVQPAEPVGDAPGGSGLADIEPSSDVAQAAISAVLGFLFDADFLRDLPETKADTSERTHSRGERQIIGYSFEKRPIASYRFGRGLQTVIFVGGIHGGYEWNTILLAYQAIDYFLDHPEAVPEDITLIIIPSANPDGQFRVTGKEGRFEINDLAPDTTSGRFNGRYVDLNRNWDCAWETTARWRDQAVSGGKKPFSESESQALRDFLLQQQPEGVVFWHSRAGGVYGAWCQEFFQPAQQLAEIYGAASGYPFAGQFTYYPVTGDAGDWLSTQGIPSISVELATHDFIEWPENLAGIMAVLEYHSQPAREALAVE